MLKPYLVLAMGLAGLAACAANLPPATYDSVHYGPHERQVVDVWLPDGVSKPVPVVVNIHGGSRNGFRNVGRPALPSFPWNTGLSTRPGT